MFAFGGNGWGNGWGNNGWNNLNNDIDNRFLERDVFATNQNVSNTGAFTNQNVSNSACQTQRDVLDMIWIKKFYRTDTKTLCRHKHYQDNWLSVVVTLKIQHIKREKQPAL